MPAVDNGFACSTDIHKVARVCGTTKYDHFAIEVLSHDQTLTHHLSDSDAVKLYIKEFAYPAFS